MSNLRTIISIDQGTTSSRAILFAEDGKLLAQRSAELTQYFPSDGWVEHNPKKFGRPHRNCIGCVREAHLRGGMPMAIGITNQRETAIIWDRVTGEAIHNAIV